MKRLSLICATIFLFSCDSRTEKYYENDRIKYEVISINEEKQILKEYNASGQVITQYEMIDSIKNGLATHFREGEIDFKTTWINDQQSVIIEDISGRNQIQISHNFPDTLVDGDTVRAVIASMNKNWRITKAFVNCPVGSDGVFRLFNRTRLECLELAVVDNQALIQFVTQGQGEKVFDKVTLILENKDGIKQASGLDFRYYLK